MSIAGTIVGSVVLVVLIGKLIWMDWPNVRMDRSTFTTGMEALGRATRRNG